MHEIKPHIQPDSLILFDVDETLIHPATSLGSEPWRKFIRASSNTKEDVNKLISKVLQNIPYKLVEQGTPQLIKEMQNEGIVVLACTARPLLPLRKDGTGNLTAAQLAQHGITFQPFERFIENSVKDGILFTAGGQKGDFLKDLFVRSKFYPKMVIFIDDKREQAISVDNAMKQLGIPCRCFFYNHAAKFAKPFDQEISIIQLNHFLENECIISDEEAALHR